MIPPILRLSLAILLCSFAIYAQSQKPLTGKEPSWVNIQAYDFSASPLEQDAEDGYLDLVYEEQISVEPRAIYTRKVVKALTEAGVQNIAEISVDYEPSYQQLIFHTIRIIRSNKVINQLNPSKIKTIQQERELDQHLYNGSLTAMLILEDLRKGDIVEYSYTIKGSNPVFKGKFYRVFNFNFRVPVTNLYYKVITPQQHSLTLKTKGTTIAPDIKKQDQETSYEWKLSDLEAVRMQDNLPEWYDPYKRAVLSEYKSWQEVNDWALELFPSQKSLSSALQQKIAEIKQANPTPEQQITAALRFVQDEVRYMGIEVGENSHRPNNPNKIFAQRFGDCKDKSYLLCTMLNALNIEAYPVLINTYYKQSITEWLPAANMFDHATTQVKLNDRIYWFDPTISYQRGPINMISYPDYQYGLVIAPGTTDLTKIDNKEPGKVKVKEEFDVADMSGDAKFTVTTYYTGRFADNARSYTHNSSRHEIMKTYREFYAGYYEEIKADSISYEENDSTGAFITKEYYSIENLWELKDGIKKAFFSPYLISSVIKRPKDTKRKMPFAITYPAKYEEEVIVNVPLDWTMDEGKDYIQNDAFRLKGRYDYGFRKVMLTYEYEALQDHIPVEKTSEYLSALDSVDKNFSYSLSSDERKTSTELYTGKSKSNVSFYASLISLCVTGALIWFLTRKKQGL
ncbi:MAG: DUF3857 domain-containing transglutaminase family protein [Chitinophagaceae bacterium]